ncbi:MAG: dTDP-4-dehydrorhamnose 3,5-epimerase family protein [Candidatus Staskawiczbacteria bacterium]|jgi:dTDP-4-dehydrorhamnose 3,5-epimerase
MKSKIQGISITDLKIIGDKGGAVLHMLRSDDPVFCKFGEIYFSKILPGAVKAWKLHKKMTLNLAVPVGKVKLVLYDNRIRSKTKGVVEEIILSEENYKLVTVPPLIWFGFKAVGDEVAFLADCATIPYDPAEIERLETFSEKIPYEWEIKNGK